MAKTRKTSTREFKIEAVKLSYNSDKPIDNIADSLGISKSSLYRWRAELQVDPDQAFPGKGQKKEQEAEIVRLKKELRQAQMVSEILNEAVPSLPSCSVRALRIQANEISVH